jgi:hypothetical protein
MMEALIVHVDGIGFWAPGIADWNAFVRVVVDGGPIGSDIVRLSPDALPPAERRRAPEPVLLASETAGQACAMAERDASVIASVFASTHGDLAITDSMCETLAADPRALSPTRFHNSVHNAPAGYWTVATHCRRAATAISAFDGTFAAGLLEAATEATSEGETVLICAYDIASKGPLAEVAPSASPFGVAFVIGATRTPKTLARLSLRLLAGGAIDEAIPSSLASIAGNPMAMQSLPLLVALAKSAAASIDVRAGDGSALRVGIAA